MLKVPKIRHAFSPSFLKKWMACPYSAIFDKFTENPSTMFGNVVHELFAKIYDIKNPLCKSFFMKNIEFELTKGKLKNLDYKKFHDKADKINLYLQAGNFDPPEGFDIWDVESQYAFPQEFKEVIYGKNFFLVPLLENDKRIRGQIDLVYCTKPEIERTTVIVRDWKTGTADNEPFQIVLYLLALIRAFMIETDEVIVKGEYCYVETGKIVPVYFDELEFIRVLDDLQQSINAYYNAYKLNFFNKCPSYKNCQWCTVTECEHYKK